MIIDNIKNDHSNKRIIEQNMIKADKLIPSMSFPSNLIYINGKINDINTRIMIDTGASNSYIFKSLVDKCNLTNQIDPNNYSLITCAYGCKKSLGTLWFINMFMVSANNKFTNIRVNLEVIDIELPEIKNNPINLQNINNNNINNNNISNDIISNNFEIILK